MKTAVAVVCVVAAGIGGLKAYNTANQSHADMLFAENVEALSQDDGDNFWGNHSALSYYANLYGWGNPSENLSVNDNFTDRDAQQIMHDVVRHCHGYDNRLCTVFSRLQNGQDIKSTAQGLYVP